MSFTKGSKLEKPSFDAEKVTKEEILEEYIVTGGSPQTQEKMNEI